MMKWAFSFPFAGSDQDSLAACARRLCKNPGMRQLICILAIGISLVAPHSTAAAEKMYKWTDENGVVHYGDYVPARYVKSRTEVLNSQGVTVDVLEAQKTPEDLAEEIRLRGLEEERLAAEAARRAYDRALLDSYESVDDIIATRKRRLDAVDGQIVFTTHHIGQMKNRIASIKAEIARFTESQGKRGVTKPTVPKRLADELAGAQKSLAEHEANLESHYLDQARIRIKYAEDIERFKVLRGIKEEKVAEEAVTETG